MCWTVDLLERGSLGLRKSDWHHSDIVFANRAFSCLQQGRGKTKLAILGLDEQALYSVLCLFGLARTNPDSTQYPSFSICCDLNGNDKVTLKLATIVCLNGGCFTRRVGHAKVTPQDTVHKFPDRRILFEICLVGLGESVSYGLFVFVLNACQPTIW